MFHPVHAEADNPSCQLVDVFHRAHGLLHFLFGGREHLLQVFVLEVVCVIVVFRLLAFLLLAFSQQLYAHVIYVIYPVCILLAEHIGFRTYLFAGNGIENGTQALYAKIPIDDFLDLVLQANDG